METSLMQESDPTAALDWERVRPVLDDALAEMDERDREAILLRYLEGCDFAQVGAKLSLTDNAARMRVDRAVDKLRVLLARRGVTSTAAALSLVLGTQATIAAPTGLAATVTGAALAGGGTVATLTFMSLTKLQLGIASVIAATGTGIYALQEHDTAAPRAELATLPQSSAEIAGLGQSNRNLEQAAARLTNLEVSDTELQAAAPPPVAAPKTIPAGAVFRITELDKPPVVTFRKAPLYPYSMRRAGIQGKVMVSFVIGADGKAREVHAVQSWSGGMSTWPFSDPTARHNFEMAAVAAVSEWRFNPGLKDGQMVNSRVSQMLEFKIER
jgi:TonB family protein